jgi:hypothetical protein
VRRRPGYAPHAAAAGARTVLGGADIVAGAAGRCHR